MPLIDEEIVKIEQKIREKYPDKELLKIADVGRYVKVNDYRLLKSLFKFTDCYISVHNFAKQLNEIGR